MKNILHFKRESITYYAIGQSAEYYYDLGLIPLDNFLCDDILDKSRLLYALWEMFIGIDKNKPNRVLTNSLGFAKVAAHCSAGTFLVNQNWFSESTFVFKIATFIIFKNVTDNIQKI
jgi:hypothetical protein